MAAEGTAVAVEDTAEVEVAFAAVAAEVAFAAAAAAVFGVVP